MNNYFDFQNNYLNVSTMNLIDIVINKNMSFKKLLTRKNKNKDFFHQNVEFSIVTTRQVESTNNIIVSSNTQ